MTPSLRCCYFLSTRPQIYIKSESNIQIFPSETIVSLENGDKEANMHICHCESVSILNIVNSISSVGSLLAFMVFFSSPQTKYFPKV